MLRLPKSSFLMAIARLIQEAGLLTLFPCRLSLTVVLIETLDTFFTVAFFHA